MGENNGVIWNWNEDTSWSNKILLERRKVRLLVVVIESVGQVMIGIHNSGVSAVEGYILDRQTMTFC